MRRWAVVWLGVGAAAGCDRTYGSCSGQNEFTSAAVDTSGEAPVFDWEYGTAYAVSVYELDGGELGREMWHVQCGGDNLEDDKGYEESVCIETPLVYGERVESPFLDTVNLTRPKPLEAGAPYQLWLSTLVEEDGPEPERSGLFSVLERMSAERDDPRCGAGFSAEVDFVMP